MSTTRIGKIGRLPLQVRTQLNRRLQDGEPGKSLVAWLNEQKAVQKVLNDQFDGREITEQNLSEWRGGGHEDWLRQEEACAFVKSLTEEAEELNDAADGADVSDRFARVLTVEITRLAKVLLERETDPEKKWQRLKEVARELSQLRRDDCRAAQTAIAGHRWERQMEQEDFAAEEKANSKRMYREAMAPIKAMLGAYKANAGAQPKAESGPIRPNPTESKLAGLLAKM